MRRLILAIFPQPGAFASWAGRTGNGAAFIPPLSLFPWAADDVLGNHTESEITVSTPVAVSKAVLVKGRHGIRCYLPVVSRWRS